MNYFVKLGLVLLVITVIASGILAFVNDLTKDQINSNKALAEEDARQKVLFVASRFEKQIKILPSVEKEANPLKNQGDTGPSEFVYYQGYDASDDLVGYTFVASRYGYSSEVKTMVGLGLDYKVIKIKVIEQAETPGLGANAATDVFQNRFVDQNQEQLKVIKDGGKIESLTGATITSRAVTESIAEGLAVITEATSGEEE